LSTHKNVVADLVNIWFELSCSI